MTTLKLEIDSGLQRQIDHIVRDGWYVDGDAVVLEALRQFVEAKTYLGDSPPVLHRFAADALNASKPETALKFVSRGLTLLSTQDLADLRLYQQLVELRVQILLVLDRNEEALVVLEEAQAKLPNNPSINGWIAKLQKQKARESA